MKTPEIPFHAVFPSLVLALLLGLGGCWGEPRDDIGSSLYSVTSILLDPDSCIVNSSQVDCNTVYVATSGNGIYKSLDGGLSWQRIVDGLFEWNITEMVMDPQNSSVLYAGTENSGLFQTSTGGSAWALAGPDAGMIKAITSIAIDAGTCQSPPQCSDLYVGSEETGVWVGRSFSWTQQNSGLGTPAIVTALTVDSYNFSPSALYVGTEDGHVYKWNNSIVVPQWEESVSSLNDVTNARPLVIAVNPILPSEVFVGTSGGEAESAGGTFSTSNFTSGAWTQEPIPNAQNFSVRELVFCIQIALNCSPTRLDIPPINDPLVDVDVLYAGVFGLSRSFTTLGDSWTNINLNDEIEAGNNVSSLAIDPLRHTTLYAGTLTGFIMKSQDSGLNWVRIDINF